jgi:hypothetical protein
VLVDERPARSLGGVVAWGDQRGLRELHLLTEEAAGVLARRAQCFRDPVAVWQIDGRTLAAARPAPHRPAGEPPTAALDLVGLIRDAGADIVVEHGEVRGEVLGLEVVRVVVDDGLARVEVGVGRHDREAFAMVHGDVPTPEALRRVVAEVRRHRGPGDRTHPLARLAGERWLRSVVVDDPSLVGAAELEVADATVEPASLKDPAPAIAVGHDASRRPVVVACSVGVDLDVVPSGADAREALAPDAKLVVAVPERDALPVTSRLAESLVRPAEVVAVPVDFRV